MPTDAAMLANDYCTDEIYAKIPVTRKPPALMSIACTTHSITIIPIPKNALNSLLLPHPPKPTYDLLETGQPAKSALM